MQNLTSNLGTASKVDAPDELKLLKAWVVWRYEDEHDVKNIKMSYYVTGSRRNHIHGSQEDLEKLVDFGTAKAYAVKHGFYGVSFCTLPQFGITALDFDKVIDLDTNAIHPDVLDALEGAYAEYSPSGKGIRAFIKNDGSYTNRRRQRAGGDYGFELFSTKGQVTVTGNRLPGFENNNTIIAPTEKIKKLIDAFFPAVPLKLISVLEPTMGVTELKKYIDYIDPSCSHQEWIDIGMGIHFETMGASEGFELWDEWSSGSSKYSSREYNQVRWNSFGAKGDGRELIKGATVRSIAKEHAAKIGVDLSLLTLSLSDFKPLESHIIAKKDGPPDLVPIESGNLFNIRRAADYIKQTPKYPWLYKNLLPKANVGILYGESGSGKSFIALDMCLSLARGLFWRGHRPGQKTANILYVVAEGAGGFANRLKAYCRQHDCDIGEIPIDIISDVAPNMVDSRNVKQLITEISQQNAYDLIVMDTFAQVTPGVDENSGKEIGVALNYCKILSQVTNAMVLLVHHSGKDASKGVRGWSGQKGASDVLLEVTRQEDYRALKIAKLKDGGEEGKEYGFKLHKVILDHDDEGDEITSCIVEEISEIPDRRPKLRLNQQLVVDTLNHFELYAWTTLDNLLQLCIEFRGVQKDEKSWEVSKNIKNTINNGVKSFLESNTSGEVRLKDIFRKAES